MNREHSPWSYVGWSAKSGGEFGIIAGKTAQLFEAPLGSLLNAPLRLDAARDGSPRWSIQLVEDLRRAVALTFGGQPFDNSALADTIGCHIVGIQTLAYVPMPITPSDSASDLLDPERHNNFHEGSIPLKTDTPLLFHIIHHLLDGDEWMSDLGYRAGMWLYLNGNNRTHVNYLYDAPEVGLIQISNNSGVGVRIELAPDHVTLRIFSEHGSYIETFPNPNGLYWFEWVHPSPPHTQRPVGLVILHHEVFARIPEIYRRVTVAGICDVEFSPEDEYTESQLDNFRNGRPNTDSASPKAKRPSRKGSRRSKPQSRALARAL